MDSPSPSELFILIGEASPTLPRSTQHALALPPQSFLLITTVLLSRLTFNHDHPVAGVSDAVLIFVILIFRNLYDPGSIFQLGESRRIPATRPPSSSHQPPPNSVPSHPQQQPDYLYAFLPLLG